MTNAEKESSKKYFPILKGTDIVQHSYLLYDKINFMKTRFSLVKQIYSIV